MGLFGTIGKIAGSKVFEKVEGELTKKQNQEQSKSYCNYINTNIARICKMIGDLEGETKALIGNVSSLKGVKLSFKEKGDFRKLKDKAEKNLKYLYLTRDFFTALSKNASGVMLKNEEALLIAKFAPFFDGVPVLDIDDDDDSDDSLLGEFKEIGQEFKEMFISSKKDKSRIDLDEYLYRYDEKIDEYVFPDIDSAIESFKNAMAVHGTPAAVESVNAPAAAAPAVAPSEEIDCPNCGTKMSANSKFCPECGNKIEIKKPSFCIECGEPLVAGAKFCAGCGAKIG